MSACVQHILSLYGSLLSWIRVLLAWSDGGVAAAQYGRIRNIDLKVPPRPPAFAFVEFENARCDTTRSLLRAGVACKPCPGS